MSFVILQEKKLQHNEQVLWNPRKLKHIPVYSRDWFCFRGLNELFRLRCFALSSLYKGKIGIQKSRLNQVQSVK